MNCNCFNHGGTYNAFYTTSGVTGNAGEGFSGVTVAQVGSNRAFYMGIVVARRLRP